MECDLFGASDLGEAIWSVYREVCEDNPPAHLLLFYEAYHACLRAMVAVWHLKDDVPDPQKWTAKAHTYLQTAESMIV